MKLKQLKIVWKKIIWKKRHNDILSIPQQIQNTTNDSDTWLGASVWIWAVSDRLTNRAMVTMSPSNFSASFPPQSGRALYPGSEPLRGRTDSSGDDDREWHVYGGELNCKFITITDTAKSSRIAPLSGNVAKHLLSLKGAQRFKLL